MSNVIDFLAYKAERERKETEAYADSHFGIPFDINALLDALDANHEALKILNNVQWEPTISHSVKLLDYVDYGECLNLDKPDGAA